MNYPWKTSTRQLCLLMFLWLILTFCHAFANDCFHPGVPESASLSLKENIATYACQPGYHLIRPAQRICDRSNRTWSGTAAVCGLDRGAGMPAYSSSVERRNFSAFATDVFPNDKSVQNDQSCFISTPELHPWLLVDLLQPANVDYFAVRKLGYPAEKKSVGDSKEIVEIFVTNSTTGMDDSNLCAKFQVIQPEDNILLSGPCRFPIKGRFVIIRAYRDDLSASVKLGLCSVKIFSRTGLASSQCPSASHMLLEGSCYSVEETTESGVDWSSGEKNCNSLGGHLVTIESSVVQSFLFWEVQRLRNLTLLTAGGVDSRPQLYWIGAHLDNKTHLNWTEPQETSNSTSRNDCVAVKTFANEPKLIRSNCESKGNWICEFSIKYCRAPPIPENIMSYSPIQDSYRIGQVVTFICEEQTLLVGSSERLCLPNGRWSGTVPLCRSKKSVFATQTAKPTLTCSKPQPITFGSYTVRETDVANFVEYKCHAGFSLQGNSYAVCVFPGFWNGSAPVCMPNSTGVTKSASVTHFTGNFSPVPTAKIVDNRTSPWANIWSPKLLPTGKPTRFDEELGLPTTPFDLSLEPNTILPAAAKPIRCEYPPQVVNGAYLYDSDENAIGTFLIYTCQPGFTLVGDRVLQCLHSGNWSQTPPTCQNLTTVEDLDLNNVTATLDSINQTEVAPPIIQSINSFQQITGKPSSVPPSPTGLPSTELVPTSTSQRQFPPVLDVTKLLPFERLLTTSNLPEKNNSDFTSVKCPRLGVKHAETIYLTEDTGVGSKVFLRCEKNFQLNPAGPIFECLTGGIWNATVEPVCLEENVLVDSDSGVNLSNVQNPNGVKEDQFNWALVVTCIVAVVIFLIICALAIVGILYRHRRNKRKPPTVSNPSDIIGDLESRRTSNVGDMSSTYIYTSVDSARSKPDKPAQIYAIYDSSLSRPAQLVHQQKADEEEMVEPIETLTPLRSASVRSNMVEKNNNNNKEGNMTEFYGYPMELVAKPMTRVLLVQNRLAPESLYILPFDKVDSSNGSRPLDPIKQAEKERDERPAGHQSSSTGDTGLYLAAVSVPKRQNQPEVPPPAIPRLTTTARPIEPQLGPLTLDVDTGSQTSLPSRASDVNSRLKEIGVVKPVRNHHYKDLREIRPPIVQRNGSNNDRTNESILISDHILPSTSENPSQIETTTSPSQQRRQIHVRDLQEEIINSPLFQKLRRKYGDADSNAVTNVIDTEAPTVRISTTRRTRIPLPPPPLPPARQSPQTAQPTSSKPSPPLKESVRNGPTKDNRNLRIVRSEISPTQQERIYQNPGYSPTLMSSKPSGTYNNLPAKPESPDVHNFGRKSLRVADDTALQQHMRPSDIRDLVYLPRIRGSPDRKLRSHQHKASSIDSLIDLAESPEFVYSSGHQSDYPFGHYTAAADDQISLNGVETQESDGSLSEDEFRLQRQGFISEALVNGRGLVSPKTAQHPVVTHSPLYSTDRPSRSESRPNHLRRVGNGENLSRENGYNNDSFVSDSGSENESPLVYTNNLRRHSLNEHHRSHHNGNSVPVGGSYRQRRSQDGNGRSMRDTAVIYDGPVRRTSKRRHRQSAVEGIPLELVAETRPYGNETVDILNGTDSRNEFNSRLVTGRGDVLDLDPLADFSDQWGMVGRRKPASKSASSFPDLSDSYRSDGAIWDSKPLRGRSKRVQFKDEVDQFEPDNSRKSGRKKINK